MNIARKVRPGAAAAALLCAWIAHTQQPPQEAMPAAELNVTRVFEDLYVIRGGPGGNVGVYVTGDGVVLVDDMFDRDHDQLLRSVKSITSQPVKYVINTHFHIDHSGGNAKMLPVAEVISTANARRHITRGTRPQGPPPVAPARIVFTEEFSVFLGGKEVRARYFGRGHTNSDAFVYFPSRRTIHTGDMMNSSTPLIDYASGGSIVEWTKTFDELTARWDFDTVIPGHGPVTKKENLVAYRNKVETLRNRVQAFIRQGRTGAEVQKFLSEEYWGYDNPAIGWGFPGILNELR